MASEKAKISRSDIGSITPQQQRQLTMLARAMNRRLERATEGQRKSLEHNIKGYHTRTGSRGIVFQQGKAKTEAEYWQRMAELKAFEKAKTSTRGGWEALKQSNMEKSQTTLKGMGYDISDAELEAVLKETGGSSKAFYRALENVQAAKGPERQELSPEEVKNAVNERRTDYQATLAAIKARS